MNTRLEQVEAEMAEYLYGEREPSRWAVRLLEAERKRLSDPELEDTVVILDWVEEITEEWRVLARVNGLWYRHPCPCLDQEGAEAIAARFIERGTVALELWEPVLTVRHQPEHREAA